MVISMPEYFHTQKIFDNLILDDLAMLNYKTHFNNEKVYNFSGTNLLIIILKGKKTINYLKGELDVSAGEIVFIRKGNYIMYHFMVSDDTFESIVVSLSDELLLEFYEKYFTVINNNIGFIFNECSKIEMSQFLKSETESLLNYFVKNNDYSRELLKLKIFSIILNIVNEDPQHTILWQIQDIVCSNKLNIKKIMEDNYDKPMKMLEFAKLSGLSLTAFKNCFKKQFFDSPKNWITNRRLEKAEYLLQNSDYNITEICFLVGFKNLSHFVRLFKNKFGIPPKQYKSQLNS